MKFLLTRNKDKGLYLFTNNNLKFVVAIIEDDNGIGEQVYSWWHGKYFATLKEALDELSK